MLGIRAPRGHGHPLHFSNIEESPKGEETGGYASFASSSELSLLADDGMGSDLSTPLRPPRRVTSSFFLHAKRPVSSYRSDGHGISLLHHTPTPAKHTSYRQELEDEGGGSPLVHTHVEQFKI